MRIRTVLFWIHLAVGSILGIVILNSALTGILLAYRTQIIDWSERKFDSDPPSAGAVPMNAGALLVNACATLPAMPTSVSVKSDPRTPMKITLGRDQTMYFNLYTGALAGVGSQRTRKFFQSIEHWHRWLGTSESHHSTAAVITGSGALCLFVLSCTGIVLWWPRNLSRQRLKSAIKPRFDLPASRARNLNWHTVTGFWCALVLAIIGFCGVVMAFPWANNLLFRVTGNTPTAAASEGSRGQEPALPARSRTTGGRTRDRDTTVPAQLLPACANWNARELDTLWNRAKAQQPDWREITLRLSANSNPDAAVFVIDQGSGGRPDKRSQLTLAWHSATVVRWEPFSSYNMGRQLRLWVRFSHTGEAGGLVGETVVIFAAAGVVCLYLTGVTMTWKRFRRRSEHPYTSAYERVGK